MQVILLDSAQNVFFCLPSSVYPGVAIKTMAITYRNENGKSNRPISPCGVCRQTLVEYEARFKHPIRLILGGHGRKDLDHSTGGKFIAVWVFGRRHEIISN
jgi:hypothetical protein